jgi:nucleoside-diphosphate-sugar epimerase
MKILLTGASGFIGKNYLESTGYKKISTISTSNLEFKKLYKHRTGDLKDKDFLKKVSTEKYDVIIHAAWAGLPGKTEDLNILNFNMYKNILNSFSNNPETNHIFLGSCLEYGSIRGIVNENDKGQNIEDFGQKKLDLLNYIQESGLKYNWIRLFYIYGKYQHTNSLINSIHKDIYNNRRISLQNINKSHDFMYIKDAVSLIDMVLSNNLSNGVFNCGSGNLTSIGFITNNILEIMGKYPLFQVQTEPGLTADISKASNILNWKPKYSLFEGIMETLKGVNLD